MAGPSIGALGSVAWTTGANATLASTGVSNMEWTLNLEGEEFDSTIFGNTGAMTAIKGLQSWDFEFGGYLVAPDHGAGGLVTFGAGAAGTGLGGSVLNLNAWDMNITRDEIDTTLFNATVPTVKSWIPGLFKGGGSFSGFLDSATSTTIPTFPANSSEPATGTFRYQEKGVTDNTLSGSMFTTRASWGARVNAANPISYNYRLSGDITQSTPSAGAGILPAGALASTAIDTITLKSDATRTFTGSAFWTSIAISVRPRQLVSVRVRGRGTGALTISA